MQRLHEDDLVGNVLGQEPWEVMCFPAIAEADEVHEIATIWGPQRFTRLSFRITDHRAGRLLATPLRLWNQTWTARLSDEVGRDRGLRREGSP
jgi:hypothetical protein